MINGVSLTIAKIKKNKFEIWVIPHTLKLTNLANIKKNDLVNIYLSKYGVINLRSAAVDQSIEIVRRRIDEIGTN